jgi:2-C-methyl-D-erythritol 4-phosphate cytidylyltransferase
MTDATGPRAQPPATRANRRVAAVVPAATVGQAPATGADRRVAAVVPAAGLGRRLGRRGPKALVRLAGRPLLCWALADLEAAGCLAEIVVVTRPNAIRAVRQLAAAEGFAKISAVVEGGPTRRASVAAGLAALTTRTSWVAVHDGSRPLAGPALLDHLLEVLVADGDGVAGVVPGLPVTDTVREVDADGRSKGIVDRDRLRSIQTPQLFSRAALERAHALAAEAGVEATDDSALIELVGGRVRVVPGQVGNLKVTTALDLAVAETIVARRAGT